MFQRRELLGKKVFRGARVITPVQRICGDLAAVDSCHASLISGTLMKTAALEASRHACHRALIRSATRKALAMMVRVGFTAPMDGKKLASVT